MLGSDFVRTYHDNGLPAWEAAALALAREGSLTPWSWVELPLSDASGNTAVLRVRSDVLAVGTLEDHVRLPLTPGAAQGILNLSGELLPTPWLVYQMWRASPFKLVPTPMIPNLGGNLAQYAQHSAVIDTQLITRAAHQPDLIQADSLTIRQAGLASGKLISGTKKHVVVGNFYKPGKVLIFGWYRPSPPYPDVFDDRQPMADPDRQPIQPKSNVHGAFYVDYSHGIQAVHPTAIVNGQLMSTEELYQHPTLSQLVSDEGPVRTPRYPSPVPVARIRPAHVTEYPAASYVAARAVPDVPGFGAYGPTISGQPRRRNW